jgi:hypothetical protein
MEDIKSSEFYIIYLHVLQNCCSEHTKLHCDIHAQYYPTTMEQ